MSLASPSLLPQRPSPSSPLVQGIIHSLTPHLRLKTILNNLKILSKSLRTAQAHTAPFNTLYLHLHRVTILITNLSVQTESTLASFRRAATTSLDNLDLVSDLLSDDLQPVAVDILSSEKSSAKRLAAQSAKIALQFDDAATQLTETLSIAVQTRAGCEARRAALAARVADRWQRLRRARDTVYAANAAISDAERLHDQAAERESHARMASSALQVANVAAMVGSVMATRSAKIGMLGVGGTVAALSARADAEAMRAREERAVHLKLRMDARKDKLEGSRDVSEHGETLRAVRNEETLEDDVLASLEEGILALRSLAGVMVGAETFWKAAANECSGGGTQYLLGLVRSGGMLEDADRKALWQSPKLGNRMREIQAKYVALENVCNECIVGMGSAVNGLYSVVGDSSGSEGDSDTDGESRNVRASRSIRKLTAEDIEESKMLLDHQDDEGNR